MAIALENYASGGSSGGGSGSDPDGTGVINRDSSGNITSIVLTYDGGVKTTTFSKSGNSDVITEEDVPTGSATKTVVTTTITGDRYTQVTTEVPVT